jgi:D-lactate dehydrogenase
MIANSFRAVRKKDLYNMKVAVYSSHKFEMEYLLNASKGKHDLIFIQQCLDTSTVSKAEKCEAIAAFVSDDLGYDVLLAMARMNIKNVTLRSAGYNHVNLSRADKLGIRVARVPAYSPNSVAEHAIALMMGLNRKLIIADNRTHELNFSLDGLVGFDMVGKTVGIVGLGKIGCITAKILHGFGCKILACDKVQNKKMTRDYGVQYVDLSSLCEQSDIISLHVPLTMETHHLINKLLIKRMKPGVMLINTGRGALINTKDVIEGLKSRKIGYFGMDVYEDESLFFKDHSGEILKDDVLGRLMSFSNVIITGHQAFLTAEALKNIAETTIYNLDCFEKGIKCKNSISIKL